MMDMFVNHTLDLIPENKIFTIDNFKKTCLGNVSFQHLSRIGLYKNLRQIIHKSPQIEEREEKPPENILNTPIGYHIIIEHICIISIVIVVVIISFRYKKQQIRVYTPEIAQTEC